MSLKDKITVLVIVWDDYLDAIRYSQTTMKMFWPNRSCDIVYAPINLGEEYFPEDAIVSSTGGDKSFDGRLKAGLKMVKTDYVLVLLEDYLIANKVDEDKISETIDYMASNDIPFAQLNDTSIQPRGKKIKGTNFLDIDKIVKYRINFQATIYKTSLLSEISSHEIKTPPDGERYLFQEKYHSLPAIYVLGSPLKNINYINKGKATAEAVRFLKKNNLWKNDRKKMSTFETLKWKTRLFLKRILRP